MPLSTPPVCVEATAARVRLTKTTRRFGGPIGDPESAKIPVLSASRPARVTPLAPSRYELKVTVSEETRDKLRRAQDLLRHAIPSGDTAEILDRALTLLLADLARKKFAATRRPRQSHRINLDSREPAAEVKRAVCERDETDAPTWLLTAAGALRGFLGVSPPEDVRQRRSGDGRQHLPPLPEPQPVRGRPLLEGIVREADAPYGLSTRTSTRSGTAAGVVTDARSLARALSKSGQL
jgi:hypothetical protein